MHVLVRMSGCLCGSEGAAHLLHYRLNLDRRSGVLRLLSSAENLGYHTPPPFLKGFWEHGGLKKMSPIVLGDVNT